jgi:hypothetical protein
VADSAHAQTAEAPVLTQAHALTVADATHAHTAEAPVLTQAHSLVVADAAHAHTAEAPALTQVHSLTVADSAHAHTVDSIGLIQLHVLLVASTLHAHTANNVNVIGHTTHRTENVHGDTGDPITGYRWEVDQIGQYIVDALGRHIGAPTLIKQRAVRVPHDDRKENAGGTP